MSRIKDTMAQKVYNYLKSTREHKIKSLSSPCHSCALQAQLVKDRHSIARLESLYSDEEDEGDPVPENIQMTWTKEKCDAEKRNRGSAVGSFRDLITIKP